MNSKTLFYVLKRIGLAILTIWVVITITFFVMHAVPGGPFVGEKATTPAVQAAMEAQKSRVKAEKTKIFFQKASSGFGDVSFKERSGRFKA